MMNDELYHYGVLGMKWGVRRYQNKNGKLTPEGKKKIARKTFSKSVKSLKRQKKAAKKYSRMAQKETGRLMARRILNYGSSYGDIKKLSKLRKYNRLSDRYSRSADLFEQYMKNNLSNISIEDIKGSKAYEIGKEYLYMLGH